MDVDFATLLDGAPEGVVVVDREGRIALVNREAERLFGYARDELLGRDVEILLPERLRVRSTQHRSYFEEPPSPRALMNGLELAGLRKDGAEFPLEVNLAPTRFKDTPLVYAGVRDASERRRTEHELERLRRQQELLLNTVSEGFITIDSAGAITFANPAAAKILGHRVDELIGRSEHDLFHAKRPDGSVYVQEMCPIHRSVADGTIHHAAGEVFTRKSGASFPVEYTSAPVRDRGRIVGASVVFSDVSERQRADEAQREANRRVFAIYEALPDAFLAVDRDWRITYLNPPAERMLGTHKDDLLRKLLWDAFPELRGTPAEAEYRRAMSDRVRVRLEHYSDRHAKWLEAAASPSDEGLAVHVRDITGLKRGEEAVREASIARPLARRIVQDLVEQGAVAHQILTQVGRKLANETPVRGLQEHLSAYREMGLGKLEAEKSEGGRYSFSGSDLLERRPGSRVATCSFTLGYLSEAVSHVHKGEPTLGTEIECQSRGAEKCRFVVQVKKPEEGLARRVKELI